MSGHRELHPHGYAIWQDRESDKRVELDALQCCHCGCQFWVTPGSGKRRGWCHNCNQVTCGSEACDNCIHWRKKLELIEAGKAGMELFSNGQTAHSLPVSISVPEKPPADTTTELIVPTITTTMTS